MKKTTTPEPEAAEDAADPVEAAEDAEVEEAFAALEAAFAALETERDELATDLENAYGRLDVVTKAHGNARRILELIDGAVTTAREPDEAVQYVAGLCAGWKATSAPI